MEAKELRIGNILKYTNSKKVKPKFRGSKFAVIADDILYLSQNPDCDYVKPVRLTATLFKRSISNHKVEYPSFALHYLIVNDWSFEFSIDGVLVKNSGVVNIRIEVKYLHTLQNLVTALSGEELQINL